MERMDARRPKQPLLYDPLIIPRVKQYLEENVHQTYVDVGVMARHLQEKYRDYGRRKIQPFRFLVDQAYKTVLHSYGLDSNPSSEDDENSDLELMEDNAMQSNHMNNMLTSMYGGNSAPGNAANNAHRDANTQNEFPIAISSDESDGENAEKKKGNNGRLPKDFLKIAKEIVVSAKADVSAKPDVSAPQSATATNVKEDFKIQSPPVFTTILPQALASQATAKKRKIEKVDNPTDNATEKISKVNAVLASRPYSKKFKKEFAVQTADVSFENVGGIDKILKELCELLLHIKHPDVYKHIGLPPPRGFLLHGPPGCGKTLLAQAIAGQLKVGLIQVAATELITGVSGESEERIRELFEQAAAVAPCVLFIDEIDTISSNRMNAQKDMERRIVAQLITSLDGLSKLEKGEQVLVIGATNRADALDPALRRVGRFDQEICLGIPDRDARSKILRVICKNLRLESFFDFESIATLTPGYVGADLLALATRAASLAVKRVLHNKQESALKQNASATVDKPAATVPLVDISDEILMEIDSVLEQAKRDDEEENAAAENTAAMEITISTDTTSTDVTNEANLTATNTEEVSTKEDVPAADSESKHQEENNKKLENSNINANCVEKTEEVKAAETNESENDPTKVVEKAAETSKITEEIPAAETNPDESIGDVQIIEPTKNETLGEALLNNDAIKEQMGLDMMFKWLTNLEPLVSKDDLDELFITMDDFNKAVKLVQPSAKREGFITVPDVTWDDIGSLRDIRQELSLAILAPVKFPKRLAALGLHAPSGVLLCGPPGCGKTLLAKAIANEAGINFISVKGPELLNMYVGESERAIRQCFQRGRNSAPCVIFFDEFDALCPKRSNSSESNASSRVVNQLLTEMDGVEDRNGVFLMAATNRPDMIDAAVLRPGRLDKILYVGLPEQQDRFEILQAQTKKGKQPVLANDVALDELSKLTESFTGADLAGLVRQASLQALKESLTLEEDSDVDLKVYNKHFTLALQHLRPSVSTEDKLRYEKLRLKYAAVPEN